MKKTVYSQSQEHIDNLARYGDKLKLASTGAFLAQSVEWINSTVAMSMLIMAKLSFAGGIVTWGVIAVASALSWLVQMLIRVNFSTLARLRNDSKPDKTQTFEIWECVVLGFIGCIIAVATTFSVGYSFSKEINAFDRHDVIALQTEHKNKINEVSSSFDTLLFNRQKQYEKKASEISKTYENKEKTAKTNADVQYILSQKTKAIAKAQKEFDSFVSEQQKQKNNSIAKLDSTYNAIIQTAQTENKEGKEIETEANSNAYYLFFLFSIVLVSLSAYMIYKKGKYMELCGISVIDEKPQLTTYHTWIIVTTFFRRVFVNHVKKLFININNWIGTDLDGVVGSGIDENKTENTSENTQTPQRKKPQISYMKDVAAVQNVTAHGVELKTNTNTPETQQKNEVEKTNVLAGDVVEFGDKKIGDDAKQMEANFLLFMDNYFHARTNSEVEKGLAMREAQKKASGGKAYSSALAHIRTAVPRHQKGIVSLKTENSEKKIEALKKGQKTAADAMLFNGLFLIRNGHTVKGYSNGLPKIEVSLKS